ncbi:MAG: hypothetical protein KAI91_07280, partial [Candidatus Omnitrophica bacterium]|nr:hypothetical protein [Candidatus Omnitrophota bacterium]
LYSQIPSLITYNIENVVKGIKEDSISSGYLKLRAADPMDTKYKKRSYLGENNEIAKRFKSVDNLRDNLPKHTINFADVREPNRVLDISSNEVVIYPKSMELDSNDLVSWVTKVEDMKEKNFNINNIEIFERTDDLVKFNSNSISLDSKALSLPSETISSLIATGKQINIAKGKDTISYQVSGENIGVHQRLLKQPEILRSLLSNGYSKSVTMNPNMASKHLVKIDKENVFISPIIFNGKDKGIEGAFSEVAADFIGANGNSDINALSSKLESSFKNLNGNFNKKHLPEVLKNAHSEWASTGTITAPTLSKIFVNTNIKKQADGGMQFGQLPVLRSGLVEFYDNALPEFLMQNLKDLIPEQQIEEIINSKNRANKLVALGVKPEQLEIKLGGLPVIFERTSASTTLSTQPA